ncbi:IS4/Tn5 family transposase DNA-binding protein, partial [Rubripirellula amarantea]
MASQWVMDEMETADLRDKRLERRLVELLDTLSQSSTASIPAACHDRAEMVAAYRFFDNDKVGFEEVLAPHIDATYARLRQQRVALLVQDTTELDLTRPSSEVEGAGPMAHGRRSGAFMH